MGEQRIKVSVNYTDEEVLQKMMTKAIADIILGRINRFNKKERELIYKRVKEEMKEDKN